MTCRMAPGPAALVSPGGDMRMRICSGAIVNIGEGATVTLPEPDGRYMAAMVVQNDHYSDQVFKTPGEHVIQADTVLRAPVGEMPSATSRRTPPEERFCCRR